MRSKLTGLILAGLCMFSAGVAKADSVAIQNSSFEDTNALNLSCGAACTYNDGPIPGWTATGGQSGSAMLGGYYSTAMPDGSVVAYSNGGTISQTLAASLLPDSTYTLSVFVGDRSDNPITNYSFSLLAGSTVLGTFSGSTGAITPGTFQQEFLTYTTGSGVTSGNLAINLTSAGLQTDWDNVQLAVGGPVSTPEPGSLLMLGSGLIGLAGLAFCKSARSES